MDTKNKKHPDFLELRLYMNRKKTKYCKLLLYAFKYDMQVAYKKYRPHETKQMRVAGAHCGYVLLRIRKDKREILTREAGTIFLSMENCGAGVVTHEILHAILWAHGHTKDKQQYPFTIKNMKHEEEILYDFTHAVSQFYNWYWKVEKKLQYEA